MHDKPVPESSGTFEGDWKLTAFTCRKCGVKGKVFYLLWKSNCGGYEDEKYECRNCNHAWWVEGPDS